MIQRYFIDGIEVNEPNNYQELFIELNYETQDIGVQQSGTVNSWEIGVGDQRNFNDGLNLIKTRIASGLSGGLGVTEGLPFRIELDDEKGTKYVMFDGYLDLWRAKVDPDKVTAPATEQGKLDWLNQVADSFTFEYLYSVGEITHEDFIAVPYVINRKANGLEIAITALSIYTIVQQIQKAINDLINTANDYDIIYISTIIRVIAQVVQLIVLVVAAVQLTIDLFNMLVQPVKYHYGMYVKDMLRIGLGHLGLAFSSSILNNYPYNELAIIPEKFQIYDSNGGIFDGVPGLLKPSPIQGRGFFRGTLGDLLRLMQTKFHAKRIIDNGTFYFEKQNFKLSKPVLVLPDVQDNGLEYNHEDFISNLILSYMTDINDRNTIQEYAGTSVQIITTPKNINNQKMVLTRNLQEINFGFALGKRKTSLSKIEQRLEEFNRTVLILIDQVTKIIDTTNKIMGNVVKQSNKFKKILKTVGININFNLSVPKAPATVAKYLNSLAVKIDGSRLNMLKMENDYVYVPKMILVKRHVIDRQNVLSPGNETYLNARYIYETFHKFKSFVPDSDGNHNQYIIKDLEEIPFVFSDYQKVMTNNSLLDAINREGRLISLKFNRYKQTVTGRYKVNQLYTTNLKQEIIEPDGK